MEARISQSLQLSPWIDLEKVVGKPSCSLRFSQCHREKRRVQMFISNNLKSRRASPWDKPVALKVSCCTRNFPASVLQSGSPPVFADTDTILKSMSEEIEPYLNGRCIYLVGMMGSGKTTVGRILSEALGYSFFDCDSLVEQAAGGIPVSEIFRLHGENFFRDNETGVLHKLSLMHRLVVSTGGGAVIRPINWKHMRRGISIWLDVPLEALARRITAVGTDSRPLLHHEAGDAYAKTFKRLVALLEDRGEAYANANARVSLEKIAAKLGCTDVCTLTPTMIAIEALVQIEEFVKQQDANVH